MQLRTKGGHEIKSDAATYMNMSGNMKQIGQTYETKAQIKKLTTITEDKSTCQNL